LAARVVAAQACANGIAAYAGNDAPCAVVVAGAFICIEANERVAGWNRALVVCVEADRHDDPETARMLVHDITLKRRHAGAERPHRAL
jgi:hypothetical protein